MNICFYADDPKWSQLSNGGGTRTILLSAKTLQQLGHKVSIVAHKDRFTWFEHIKPVKSVPKHAEVVVAVHVCDVPHVLKYARKHKVAYWARPFETWAMPELKIVSLLKRFHKAGGTIMANSRWPVEFLQKHGVPAHVQYAGIAPYEFVGREGPRNSDSKPVVGCQFSKAPRKGWKKFKKLHKILGDKAEYVAFGSSQCDVDWCRFAKCPSHEALQMLYSCCDYFFCPNKLEGFYNVGAEAGLSGCRLVRFDYRRNGMADYSTRQNSLVVGSVREAAERIVERAEPAHQEWLKWSILAIGTREENMQKMVEVLG
ncbi:MAG: hypothetical protein GF393_13065 [Armatimonadia bacterium]|nr:hypothetical protein [Armatimonadia bacterium]